MKLLFDFFPVLLFFIAYKASGGDIFIATTVAIAAGLFQLSVQWLRTRRLETMHLVTLALLVVFGGATLMLHDETYIKWKPTVVNWLFAAVFLGSHCIGKRPLMQRVLGKSVDLPHDVWTRLNLAWAAFFLGVGAANIWVVYNFSTEVWVNFKLFGVLGLTAAFVLLQSLYILRHVKAEAGTGGEAE